MYLIILVILIAELFTVSNGEDNYCMSNCNCNCNCQASRNEQPSRYEQPSLYEQHCCNLRNIGNTIKIEDGKLRTKIICPSDLPISCFQFYNYSCSQIHQVYPSATSGYYNITLTNGSIVTVYCDMEGMNCDEEGGWTRVAYLNMTEPGNSCPSGLTQTGYININHDVCGRPNSSSAGCDSTIFSTYGIDYTKLCGQMRGYQFGSTDGFNTGTSNIESRYVDGVSITYGSNPRQHIWTYAAGLTETRLDSNGCPCNSGSSTSPPPFVGNDYYCESGSYSSYSYILYADDPLWDGQNCNGPESTCCTNPNMPFFVKSLNETTTEDIELRVCSSGGTRNEEIPLYIIEVYVK